MSVKLLYGVQNKDLCSDAEKLGGFCYCRLNPTGKSYGDKIYKDGRKVSIDLAKCASLSELSRENPIEMSLDFGIVPVESKTFRDITVYNSKDLKTPLSQFQIFVEPLEELMENYDKVFHILLSERVDILPALTKQNRTGDAQFRFRVLFKPKLPAIACTTTLFVWIGSIPIKLKCHGYSEGPFVGFSQNVLNFGGQYYGSETSIRIDMINHSICDAYFQFDCDNFRSAFKICPMSGTIPASATVKLIVVFRPHKPQTFYKRVYCLLHQQNPQYIDLVGVCIPRPFFIENPIDFCVSSADTLFLPLPSPTFEEYFQHDLWGIKLSQEDFNFGGKDVSRMDSSIEDPSFKTFTLTSTLPYDVLVEWVRDPTQIFVVSPQSAFLNAHQSTTFHVSFCPQFPDTFFAGQLECYIYPTTYIWPPRRGPPWVYARREKLALQSRATTTSGSHPEPIHTTDQKEKGIIETEPVLEEEEVVQSDEYHSSLATTAESFRPPSFRSDVEDSLDKAVEELGEYEEDLWHMNDNIQKPPTPQIHAEQIPGQISFQLYIKNGKASVHHSIATKKHYHAVSLYDVEPFPNDLNCKEIPLPKPEEIESEEEEVVEVEEHEENEEELKLPAENPKKKKKKKTDSVTKKKKKSKEKKGETEVKEKVVKKEKPKSKEKKEKKEKKDKKGKKKKSKELAQDVPKEESVHEEEAEEESIEVEGGEDEEEEEMLDLMAMGDCSDHLLKRGDAFTVPKSSHSDSSDPMELALPLCLTIRVVGHTYKTSSHPPIPQAHLPSRVTMSPTLPQHREFRTIIMQNASDLPMLFDIQGFDKSENYSAKPLIGVVPGEEKQILMISMNTFLPQTAAYNHSSSINLNVVDKNILSIFGYAEVPCMTMTLLSDATENVNEIVCPTTVPGYATHAAITMKNPSRFHYRFSLNFLDEEDTRSKLIFTPTPSEGIIAPFDSVKIVWKFVPYDYEAYRVPWKFHFEVLGAKSDDNFWNAVYEFFLPVSGLGTECHLSVDPKILDFELIQIFDSVSKTFTITNDGSAVIVANLLIFDEEWLQWYNKDQIQISPSNIHLGAGEKVDIRVTVRADRPVMYKFSVQYELEQGEKDPEGNPISQSQLNHLIDIIFMGDHAIAKITHIQQIAKHPAWNVEEAWAMFSITELNNLMTPLRHTAREGSLPNVPTVTFRFPSAPLGSQPALFALVLTNLSDITEYWQICTQPPKNNKLYQLRHKSRKESFVGRGDAQDTPSLLTALWTAKYGEFDTSVPVSSKLQQEPSLTMAALKNSEMFKSSPNSGTIDNRKTQQINFKFSYDAVGEFRMPVLLRVFPAIFVWLELQGNTLEPSQPSLQLMNNEMTLHPIGLTDLDPPMQFFWLYNGGVVPTTFEIDMEPFQVIKGRNFGHGCIECLTSEGVALPKSWTSIKLRFAPLEYRTYIASLRIKSNNVWQTVQLKGKTAIAGEVFLHPNAESRTSHIFDPFVPIVLTPSQVILSHFIPTGDSATSIIFITNTSSKHSMSFAWPENTVINSTSIKFLPDIGILAPKEQCACQVIIQAGSVNQILSTTIRCWIEDVTAVNKFHRNDKLWKGEIVEYEEVTVVTKKEGPHKVRQAVSQHRPHKPFSYSRLLGISCYIGSVFGTLDSNLTGDQKMSLSDPFGIQPIPGEGTEEGPMLNLSTLNRHLAKEVISQILWDVTLMSPNLPDYLRQTTKRQSVYFEDYKRSELATDDTDEMRPTNFRLPQKLTENVLQFVLFTMLQEMADHYAASNEKWFSLKPGTKQEEPPIL